MFENNNVTSLTQTRVLVVGAAVASQQTFLIAVTQAPMAVPHA
jgi:hypothetical protein